MKIFVFATMLALLGVGILGGTRGVEASGAGIPPWPVIYSGTVTLGGAPAPDGLWVVGKMEGYTSVPLQVRDGRMSGLAVGAPDQSYFGKTITFELWAAADISEGATIADQTDVFGKYALPTLKKDFNLTFPSFPTPTPLPTATPTVTPLPTATPIATATPIVVGPVVYNGMVVASGGIIPESALLTARIGGYESKAVPVVGGAYLSLIIDLNDPSLTGEVVKFYLNGTEARTSAVYDVGNTIRNVDLIFTDLPIFETAAATVTSTPVPAVPAAAEVADAALAPVKIEASASMPTSTPIPTQEPLPTPEPIVLVVTATPELDQPVAVEEETGGGCFAASQVDPLTGTANVLAMVGPLLLLVAFRGYRRLF